MFLLDTVILSELRRKDRNRGVTSWIAKQRGTDLYVSVVTVGEIERGIRRQESINPQFATELSKWLDRMLTLYRDRILGVDIATSRRWGRLSGTLGHDGADLMIAATALEHGLAVVTRNVRHFESTGVTVIDPFT